VPKITESGGFYSKELTRLVRQKELITHVCINRKCDFFHSTRRRCSVVCVFEYIIINGGWLKRSRARPTTRKNIKTCIPVGLETCRRVTHFEIVLKKVYLLQRSPSSLYQRNKARTPTLFTRGSQRRKKLGTCGVSSIEHNVKISDRWEFSQFGKL